MHTQNKNRSASLYALRSSVVIVAILMLAQLVTAQESSWLKQNADGSTTTFENLPGGGVRATTKDAQGKVIDTVTSEPAAKYGKGGLKITVETAVDNKPITIDVYEDPTGAVKEVNYTNYGPEDKTGFKYELDAKYDDKGQITSYQQKDNNKGPGEKKVGFGESVDPEISEQARSAKMMAQRLTEKRVGKATPAGTPTDGEQPNTSKPTLTPSDKPKTETPSAPPPTKTKGDSSLPEPTTTAEVVDAKVPGYSATIKTPPGLFTTVMTTPSKDVIEVYLPRNLVAGETVLGSMKVTPAQPDRPLIPFQLNIGIGDPIELRNGSFTTKLDDHPVTKLRLLDQKKRPVASVDFHTNPKPKPPADFWVAVSGEYGNTTDIWVSNMIDPRQHKMQVLIGTREMPVLAASSADAIILIDYPTPGLTQIEIKEGNIDIKRTFRVLKLDLSADKLNLMKNESTTLHIVVHGLENLHVPAHLKIVVTEAVTMTGATEVEIQPSEISADGTYTTTRTLNAVSAGGFSVNVTVTVDKEIPLVKSNQKGESNRSRLFMSDKLRFVAPSSTS